MRVFLCTIITSLLFFSCKKHSDTIIQGVYLSGINSSNQSEIVSISDHENDPILSNEISCYVWASLFYNSINNTIGYFDCNNQLNIIDPLLDEPLSQFQFENSLSLVVIDTVSQKIIGSYFTNDSSFIVSADLNSGQVVSKKSIQIDDVNGCSNFYHYETNSYCFVSDSNLLFIDPNNGTISNSIELESEASNAIYDEPNNRLINLAYSPSTNQNFIETISIATGNVMSSVQVQVQTDYFGCSISFDDKRNSLILLSANNDILYINIEDGKLIHTISNNFSLIDLISWTN